jgi:RimJ/RimL family protein N-acetyltransferase
MDELTSARLRIHEALAEDLPNLLPVYLSHPDYVAQSEGSAGEPGRYDLAMLQRDWQVQRMMGAVMLGIHLAETGEAVGMAGYLPEHPDDGTPWLGTLVIAAARQRQGLGAEALARLADHFRDDLGWRTLRLSVTAENASSRLFFERCGFHGVGEAANSTGMRAVVMERTL